MVATVNRAERLPALVDTILADPAAMEMVVVVDGPDHASLETLRRLAETRPRLVAFGVPRGGQLAALDAGARRARGDVVVLLDDDVVPLPGTIGRHAEAHRTRRATVAVGPMPVVTDGPGSSVATRLYAAAYLGHVEGISEPERDVLVPLWAGNLSLRREDCLRVGLASTAFRANFHQDRDLGYRFADAGLVGVYDPALAAGHHHLRSDEQFLADAERQGEGYVALHRAHPHRLGRFRLRSVVEDLPAATRLTVAACGATPLAWTVARGLMALGRRWEAAAPGLGNPLRPAKMARRIMQWHGAQRALVAGLRGRARLRGRGRAGTPRPSLP